MAIFPTASPLSVSPMHSQFFSGAWWGVGAMGNRMQTAVHPVSSQ